MKLILCVILLTAYPGRAQHSAPVGTWILLNANNKTAEVFVIRSNGDFIANELDATGALRNIEKGTWSVRRDSITFNFTQVIQVNAARHWIAAPSDSLTPVTMRFSLAVKRLTIGDRIYQREQNQP